MYCELEKYRLAFTRAPQKLVDRNDCDEKIQFEVVLNIHSYE